MNIEKRWQVKFVDVRAGQVFEYCNNYYIKAKCLITLDKEVIDMETINAIDLAHGSYAMFDYDDDVTLFENAKVVLI